MSRPLCSLTRDRELERVVLREHFVARVTTLLTARRDLFGVVGMADVVAFGVTAGV